MRMRRFNPKPGPDSDEAWFHRLNDRFTSRPPEPDRTVREERFNGFTRDAQLNLLDAYRRGEPPLPSRLAAGNEELGRFLRLGRANYAHLSVESLLSVMSLNGVRPASSTRDDRSRLQALMVDAGPWLDDALDMTFSMRSSAIMVGRDAAGDPVITAEDPRNCMWQVDPLDPYAAKRALKVWTDEWTGEQHGRYFAFDDRGREYVRVAVADEDGWRWDDEKSGLCPVQGLGLPLVPMENKLRMGEFEPHLEVLDRINSGIADRLFLMKTQALRQRILRPTSENSDPLPDVDELGREIDYDRLFAADPGAIWQIPVGWDMDQLDQVSLQDYLASVDKDVREFCSVSGTPLVMAMSDAVNQSAEGARKASEARDNKAADRIRRFTPAVKRVARLAAAYAGLDDIAKGPMGLAWAPVGQESLVTRGQAAVSAESSDVPWETRMTEVWEFPPEVVEAAKEQRGREMLREQAQASAALRLQRAQESRDATRTAESAEGAA